MRKRISFSTHLHCIVAGALSLFACGPASAVADAATDFGQWAATPPMGWNSWDVYGSSVTETEVKANADYMAQNLKSLGWQYVTVDIRWTDQTPGTHSYNLTNPILTLDGHGRFLPAPNRFPSAAGGDGFKPLADYLHEEGLKFGIHIMRGIPKIAYVRTASSPRGYPIAGSSYSTLDVPIVNNSATWLPDMYGIAKSAAGQAYYDSLFQLYAGWGVDFVKVDDLDTTAGVYYQDEIDMIRAAIDKTGRPIVLSASPGPVPLADAIHISQNANMWRVANDFWDRWNDVVSQFQRLNQWTPYRSAGHWPDADMLPLGRIAIRGEVGTDRMSNLTHDEQHTLLALWCIARSPLIFGGDLPTSDDWTKSLISNAEVIAVDQQSANNRQLFRVGDQVAWIADAPGGQGKYLALFNLSDAGAAQIAAKLGDLGFTGGVTIRDLWSHQDLGAFSGTFSPEIASHGAGIYLVAPVPEPKSGTDSVIGIGILFGVLRRPVRRNHSFSA
jgi:alpha-galactosidase